MDQFGMATTDDINKANEKFKFREPIVLVTIICLSLLRGITADVDQTRLFAHEKHGDYSWTIQIFEYFGILNTLGPVPGVFLVPFMLEFVGHKPVFILLFSLCLLSSIISYVPYQLPLVMIGNFIVAVIKGGVRTVTTLAICEYSGPKHRFGYLIADETVKILSVQVTDILYTTGILSKESSFVSLGVVVIALACMGSVYWWPESPYWLINQERVVDSRAALLWLRAENSEARAELRALENPRRRSPLKIFWLSLLVAFLSIAVAICSSSAESILIAINNDSDSVKRQTSHTVITYCGKIAISVLLVLISYKIKRRIIYFCATIIPLVVVFVLSVLISKAQISNDTFAFYITILICNILIECGPYNFSFALFIEVLPQRYYTYISCICCLLFYLSHMYFPILSLQYRYSYPLYNSLFLFTVPAMIAVVLIYWLAPETRGKNLLDIEKQYLDRHCHEDPVLDQDIHFVSTL